MVELHDVVDGAIHDVSQKLAVYRYGRHREGAGAKQCHHYLIASFGSKQTRVAMNYFQFACRIIVFQCIGYPIVFLLFVIHNQCLYKFTDAKIQLFWPNLCGAIIPPNCPKRIHVFQYYKCKKSFMRGNVWSISLYFGVKKTVPTLIFGDKCDKNCLFRLSKGVIAMVGF